MPSAEDVNNALMDLVLTRQLLLTHGWVFVCQESSEYNGYCVYSALVETQRTGKPVSVTKSIAYDALIFACNFQSLCAWNQQGHTFDELMDLFRRAIAWVNNEHGSCLLGAQ